MAKLSKNKKFLLTIGKAGFGYTIYYNKVRPFKLLFQTSDKEQALKVFETIEENHDDFPEPIKNYKPRLLVVEDKHYTSHYLVKSFDDLNQVSFDYIKRNYESRYSQITKREIPDTDNYKLISQEIINLCDNSKGKEMMVEHNLDVKNIKKGYEEHNQLIDWVKNMVETNEVASGYNLLQDLDFLYHNLELKT